MAMQYGDGHGAVLEDAKQEEVAEEEEQEEDQVTWNNIRASLRISCPRTQRILEIFEQAYAIDSPSDALLRIRHFLGEYLIQEFDHEGFCKVVGAPRGVVLASDMLVHDLGLAASLMLHVAMAIAKAFHLEMEDWEDINEACSRAIRIVPVCYALQRTLPGALNAARALRYLQSAEPNDDRDHLNPWKSEEGRCAFVKNYGMEWEQVELFTNHDGGVQSCFAGVFLVKKVSAVQSLSIVALDALRVDAAPEGFPAKALAADDPILWEVEESLGCVLEPGIVIEAEWCELENELCFISLLKSVAPQWPTTFASQVGDNSNDEA